ncbi:MAG: hypothetical protein CLLPBCKN_001494 [Chroococcidiopsis cubana SAG 39.79]|uniref:Uncharacterized protein n=1 Tax=Chroococcidiopsis cubana SAG 39.79 TaxID=388085 RepID=A0AB37UB33_9CYAN|nr:hypothetical protein [Chroococcidiopsis cubana]MDZ4872106.1 hypothetical protein [Chroococcidiopsis cubana SAG 39.79]PSB60668.1 hypothetical protein C7B79_24875 [Chroococcidiopsis cubana CCALA 043]RUT02917.1 hypothetical protein DSM107010_61840 [Chroococcidiopsis cubana SAG 39.79]
MTRNTVRDRLLPLVTSPEVVEKKLVGHRYFVELATKKYELQDARSIPVNTQIINVVVVQPSIETIEQLLASCGWLRDWQIISYSKADKLEAPF